MPDRVRVGVLISGRGSNMAALIEAARDIACPYEIVLVASNVVDAPGLKVAADAGVPTWSLDHQGMLRAEFDGLVDAALRMANVEWVALAGYMRLLSADFVTRWRGRIVNIHPSLLPKYKGLDTHARAIAAGETVAGCSVHLVTEALDDGSVLGRTEVPVLAGDTADALEARVLEAEHKLYPHVLAQAVRAGEDEPS